VLAVAFAVVVAALSTSSSATVGAKPTLIVGSSLSCLGTTPGTDNAIFGGIAYEPLIKRKPNGTYYPGLATAWKVAADNKSITLTLRKGVRFSDGSAFNAAAVKTWFDWYAAQPGASTAIGKYKSSNVLGQYQLRVNVATANPELERALGFTYFTNWGGVASPKAVAQAKANPQHKDFDKGTFGAGPYMLDPSQSIAGNHCTYLPNPYYYDKSKIHWGKVITKTIVDQNTAFAALKTHELDVVLYGDWRFKDQALKAGIGVVKQYNLFWLIVLLDHGKLQPALGDVRVRQALNYAIDRKTIVRALLGPDALPSSSPDPYLSQVPAKVRNYYNYDPAKAKALLKAAGYANGFTFKVAGIGPDAGSQFDTTGFCNAVAQNLKAVGVTMTCETKGGQGLGTELASKTYDGFFYQDPTQPVWTFYGFYMKGGTNISDQHGFHDKVVDRLWLKGSKLHGAAAQQVWKQMQLQIVKDAWHLPVGVQAFQTFVTKKVGGILPDEGTGWGTNDPTNWYPTGK
jgi:peptide/nickel transport system substrate-binding protein